MFKLDHVTFAYPHQAPLIQDLTIGGADRSINLPGGPQRFGEIDPLLSC